MSKKLLISGLVIVVVVVAAVFVFLALNKKAPVQQTQTTPPPTTTSTGGVGNTGGTVAVVVPGFNIHQDATSPFAVILPRQGETEELALAPQPQPTPTTPAATTPTPTIGANDITNPDYTNLTNEQFLAKYYPDASQVISGQSAANPSGTDPALVSYSSAPVSTSTNQVVQPDPNVDPSQFKTSQDNSDQALANYLNSMSQAVSSLDLMSNPDLFSNMLSNPSQATINQQISAAQSTLDQVKAIDTPSSVIGMQQSLVDMYQNYLNFLNDMNQLQSIQSNPAKLASTDANSLSQKIEADANASAQALAQAAQNREIMVSNLQNVLNLQ